MLLIKKYLRISVEERRLFWQSVWYLFIAWYKTRFRHPKKYLKKIGLEGSLAPEPNLQDIAYGLLLKNAVRRAVKATPFKTKCLQQAMAGKILLNKQGVPSTIYFGVSKKDQNLKAHAWLKVGDVFITGERGHKEFVLVSFFGGIGVSAEKTA